jgi:NADH-quinone oxidoreductase subunit A
MQGWTSILLMLALGAGFAAISVLLSRVLGPRHPTAAKAAPYECGMPPVGDARERQSVKFYLVAMIFLLFDIEVAFLYPWVLALRDLGWAGYLQVVLFMLLLLAGYVYVWRKGALDWSDASAIGRLVSGDKGNGNGRSAIGRSAIEGSAIENSALGTPTR